MGMPFFIECSVPEVTYLRGEVISNPAVNLTLCIAIRRERYAWYPDNEGLPSIEFFLSGHREPVRWIFGTEDERNAEYVRIVPDRDDWS